MKVKALTIFLASLYLCYCYVIREDSQIGYAQMEKEKAGLDKQIIIKVKQRSSDGFHDFSLGTEGKTMEETAATKSGLINGLKMKKTKTNYIFASRKKTFEHQTRKSHLQEEKCNSDRIALKHMEVRNQSRQPFFEGRRHGERQRRDAKSVPDIKNCTSKFVSCKDRCMNERDPGTQNLRCSCDPYCDYFKDCCADYVQYCLRQRSSNTTKTAMKVPEEQWTCRSGIWMIASCPQSWTNQDINQSCINKRLTADNYKDVLPVVTADNKTYANRFCAQCHRQNLEMITGLAENIEFGCLFAPPSHTTNQEKIKFMFEHCKKVSLNFKKDKSKRLCFESIAKCNNFTSPEETRIQCLKQQYGLVYEAKTKKMFKNAYCALCNNAVLLSCGPFPKHGKINKFKPSSTAAPFSVIMDIGGETSDPLKLSETLSCPRGKVYDVYLETCRQGRKLLPFVSSLKIYSIAMWIKIKTNHRDISDILHKFDFSRSFSSSLGLNFTRISTFEVEVIDLDNDLIKVEFQIDLTGFANNQNTTSKNTTSLLLDSSSSFQMQIGNVTFIVIKVTTKPLTCVQTDTYPTHEYHVIPGETASIYINKTGEVLGAKEYFTNNLTIIKGKQVPVGQIVVCRQMPSANCSGMYIFLQKHEYTIFLNRSMLHKASGNLYEHGTYTWRNGTIMICTNFTATYKRESQSITGNDNKALTILTYIGFCISVICLLFVLVTYSVFADLRTIPGINLMNLCSALLVAQLLWLVGSGLTFTQQGCMAIAIVLHYGFLASFWWMSIIAFNTWRAFSGKVSKRNYRNEKGQKRKRIVRTMAVGWLPLVMYVSICVALDRSGSVVIGYGGEKGCWINSPRANLFFFAIPVGFSILWNVLFFVLIVKEIRKAIDQSKMVASQHQARQDSTVYARIAVLMGFTWVFGFVAPFTSYYLMYPFVLLNTLQGLYIAVAFGFTRRVRALYRNRRSKISKRASSSANEACETRQTKL